MHNLTKRETVQVVAALRYWGRAAERYPVFGHPSRHPMVAARFTEAKVTPLTLDELETLIGRLDGSLKVGRRPWNPLRYL